MIIKTVYEISVELDKTILQLNKQGIDVTLLCNAATLLIEFHNKKEEKIIEV